MNFLARKRLISLSKLFPKDKVAAEDWAYVTAKCEEALGYIAEARK